jgi:aryl-alcohol dehydrogenase-like predicted oxidoreductase
VTTQHQKRVPTLPRIGFGAAAVTGAEWIYDYTRDGVLASLEASLRRLGVDRVDMVFIHDSDKHWREVLDGAWPNLAKLRDEGVIRAVGVGMTQAPTPRSHRHRGAGHARRADPGCAESAVPIPSGRR